MFLPEIKDRERFASLHASAGRSMQLLVGILVTGSPCVSEPEIAARAVAAWSACHGFVALRMAGVLSNMPGIPDLATLERFTITQMTLAALADRPKSSNWRRRESPNSPSHTSRKPPMPQPWQPVVLPRFSSPARAIREA